MWKLVLSVIALAVEFSNCTCVYFPYPMMFSSKNTSELPMNTYEDCTPSNTLLPTTLNLFSNGDFLISLQTVYSYMNLTVIYNNQIHDLLRISSTDGSVEWATRYAKTSFSLQTVIKTFVNQNDTSYVLSTFSGNTSSSAISILDQSGFLLQFLKVSNPTLNVDFYMNSFYVISSTEMIVSLQLNSSTNGYGVSNLTNTDIGIASISLAMSCNWLAAIDINKDPNLLLDMQYYNSIMYIVGESNYKWLYLMVFNSATQTASNLVSYSINSSNKTYQLFKMNIIGFNDPFMLSILTFGDVINYSTEVVISNETSNQIVSCTLLSQNISSAFFLYAEFINSTQIVVYQGKDNTQNGAPYSIYISNITIDGNGIVQTVQVSYVSRASTIVTDFNKMLVTSYLSAFFSFSYESTSVTENGNQISPWYFRMHNLDNFLCDNYCVCNNTDVSSTVQTSKITLSSSALNLTQILPASLPSVSDIRSDADFVKFSNITTCLFSQSSKYSFDVCEFGNSNESVYQQYCDPQLTSGSFNYTASSQNNTLILLDYCMTTQFSFILTMNGSSTLPTWIYVDDINREMILIGANLSNTSLGSYLINFEVSSLLLITNATFSSLITVVFKNQPPQVNGTVGDTSTIAGNLLQYEIDFIDPESDQILFNLTIPNVTLSLNYTINSNSFVINWTPLANETGNFTFVLWYYDFYHETTPLNYTFQIEVGLSYPPDFIQNLTDIQAQACKKFIYYFPDAEENRKVSFTPQFLINVTIDGTTPLPSWINYSSFILTFEAQLEQVGLVNQTLNVVLSEINSGLSTNYTQLYSVIDDIVTTFQTIPNFDVNYEDSVSQNLTSYCPAESSFIISLTYPSEFDKVCLISFDPNTKVLTVTHNITNLYGSINMTLTATDLCGRVTLSNVFVVNLIQALSPSVSNSLPIINMNKADTNITIQIPSWLFYEKFQNISLGFFECIQSNEVFVTQNSVLNSSFIVINKIPSFAGSCEFSIIGTDSFNQTALTTTTLQVNQCVQSNCIECSDPTRCTKCSEGYTLDVSLKTCNITSPYDNVESNPDDFSFGFITIVMSFCLFIFLLIRCSRLTTFFTNLQLILVVSALSSATDMKSKSFLVTFYWVKGDFYFIDYFIPLIKSCCDGAELKADDNDYKFYCYSTFINYIWTVIFILLALIGFLLYHRLKNKIVFKEIVKSTFQNFYIEALFDFLLPFIVLSVFLELCHIFKNTSPFSIVSVVLILFCIAILMIKFNTKLDRDYKWTTWCYKWMFYAKILIISNPFLSFSIMAITVFLYITFIIILIKFCLSEKENSIKLFLEESDNQRDNKPISLTKKQRIEFEFKLQRLKDQTYCDLVTSCTLTIFIACKEMENHYGFKYKNTNFISFVTICASIIIYMCAFCLTAKLEMDRKAMLKESQLLEIKSPNVHNSPPEQSKSKHSNDSEHEESKHNQLEDEESKHNQLEDEESKINKSVGKNTKQL